MEVLLYNNILNDIDSIIQKHPYTDVILLEDLNAPNNKPLLRAQPLKQTVSMPTRCKTIFDKNYANIADLYSVPIILPINIPRQIIKLMSLHHQLQVSYSHSIALL
jgi:hypothetical protein